MPPRRKLADAAHPSTPPAAASPAAPPPPVSEEAEAARAKSTPLALRFECVGCRYATPTRVDGQVIPRFVFHPPCPFGKPQPDQDCRDCQFHTIIPLGQDQWDKHRYHGYGMVIPLTEEQADAVIDTVHATGASALTRPTWRDYYAQKQQEAAQGLADRERAADLERRQMGSRAAYRVQQE